MTLGKRNTLSLKLKIHCRECLDSESWISLLNQLSCSSAVPAMVSCWVREKSWWGAVPKSREVSSESLGCCPESRGQPIPPCTEVLCEQFQVRVGFKESEMFCLSFQVDFTTTSAAAAPGAGAAAKFLIYSSQNTYKRVFYCYTTVQRGKMQLWEERWLRANILAQCHHNILPAPLCSLEVPTSYSAPLITANLPALILSGILWLQA